MEGAKGPPILPNVQVAYLFPSGPIIKKNDSTLSLSSEEFSEFINSKVWSATSSSFQGYVLIPNSEAWSFIACFITTCVPKKNNAGSRMNIAQRTEETTIATFFFLRMLLTRKKQERAARII